MLVSYQITILFPLTLSHCPSQPPPNRSLVRGTKAPSSDIRKEVTNGTTQGTKVDSLESAAERRNCSSAQRGSSLTWAPSSQPQPLQESQPELSEDSSRKALKSPILQKTSSTITLQAAKVQPEPRALISSTPSSSGEEREWPAAPPQATHPTRQTGLGSQEVVSKVATRKIPIESQRDSTFPKFESKPQSQEVSEDQTVKFRCEGE